MIVAFPVAMTGSMGDPVGAVVAEAGGLGVVGERRAEEPEVVAELGHVQVDLVDAEARWAHPRR